MRNGGWRSRPAGMAPAAALALVLLAGCTGLQRNPNVVGTYSDTLSPYNYRDNGALVMMVVGVDAARYIRKEAYVPLFLQVINKSKETFQIGRESFVLEDTLGRQYDVAPAADVRERYPRLDVDRRLFQQNRSITLTYVSMYTYIASDFFPSASRPTLLVDHLSVPPHAYMEDVLYFPIPESGLNHVPLRLLFKVKELAEPVQVVFEVPKTLGVLEKEEKQKEKEMQGGPPQ